MDSTQLDNASFFPIATVKPAIKTTQWIESIGRVNFGENRWSTLTPADAHSWYPLPLASTSVVPSWRALGGDLSGPIFAGPPHDPFKSFHAASSQLLQVVWSSLNNISLPSWVVLLCLGFRTRAFFFFLISLSLLFLCQYVLEKGM